MLEGHADGFGRTVVLYGHAKVATNQDKAAPNLGAALLLRLIAAIER